MGCWMLLMLLGASPGDVLTLEQVLALADQNHVDERLASLSLAQASEDARASYQFILPRLDLFAQATRQHAAPQTAITTFPGMDASGALAFKTTRVDLPEYNRPDYNLGVRLTQPIFDGGRWWQAIAKGESDYRAAEAQRAEAKLQVHVTVAHLFFELVRAERSLAVLLVNEQRSEEQLARASALFDAARGPKSDLLAAKVNLANDRMATVAQRQRVDLARGSLNVGLGMASTYTWTPVTPDLMRRPTAPVLEVIEAQALKDRPGLGALREAQQASESAVSMARADYLPTLSAQASYVRGSPDASLVFGDPSRQYVATGTLNLTWNLFAGATTDVAVNKAKLATAQAEAQLLKSTRAVREEVWRAVRQLQAGLDALALAEAAFAAAQEGLTLADERYRLGAGSNLEARDAQLKLTSAELALLSTRIDVQLADIDTRAVMGGF